MTTFGKYFVIVLLFFSFISINVSYGDDSQGTTEQAYLIEKYLRGHKENIIDYAEKYKFITDKDIQTNLQKLDTLILQLKSIQNNIDTKSSVSNILQDIKIINEKMKLLLNEKKAIYDKNLKQKQVIYEDIGKMLSVKLDEMYNVMYDSNKYERNNLTEKEQQQKNSLKTLRTLSKELEYFGLKEFQTEEELQTSFLGALNSIKYHILILKSNVK